MASVRTRLASAGRRLLFTAELFGRRELANHAAAGAYAFLLSATPAFLVLLAISSWFLRGSESATEALKAALGEILGTHTLEGISRAYLSRPLTGFAAVFGIVNLVWAARLLVASIQRGLRTIWADAGPVRPVRESLLTFAVEIVLLFAVIALLAASQAARIVLDSVRDLAARGTLLRFYRAAYSAAPHAALFLFAYGTYRTVPPVRPRHLHCLGGAALCAFSYALLRTLLGSIRNIARYDLLYGVLGNLILGLINVYLFFSLYFFFAGFVYVLESFDALLLGRYLHRKRPREAAARASSQEARMPFRLLRRFGRDYPEGAEIFRTGEESTEVFLLREGEVGIFQAPAGGGQPVRVSTVRPGEFFGEMAYLLGDRRTATTVALTPVSVLALPVRLFERFLAVDAKASRRLVKLLSARLSETTRLAAEAQARDALVLDDGYEAGGPE